jgi:hypothetical protein
MCPCAMCLPWRVPVSTGTRLRVELAKGGVGGASSSFGPPVRSEFRVLVEGLPAGTSWQDLKGACWA